jgi:predicted N-acetyltransferase YhbS
MRISYLADHPEFIPALAPPLWAQWRDVLPEDATVECRVAKLQEHMNRRTLPIAWIAHAEGELLGTAALRVHDLEGREDLSPWLGGVFVLPAHRRKGVASALCRTVEDAAWHMDAKMIYLFTPEQQALYSRLGWKHLEHANWRGLNGSIMFKKKNA